MDASHHLVTIALSLLFIASAEAYTPRDNILLDCGSSSSSSSLSEDGRRWEADIKYLPPNSDTLVVATKDNYNGPAVTKKSPYNTARIFHSPLTYTFTNLSTAGPKFIRFHFYPYTYVDRNTTTTYDAADSYLSVIANEYTLLTNFSPSLHVPYFGPIIHKEYVVRLHDDDRQLNITISPSSPNSFAFLNGIEIVSMPDNLYYPTRVVGPNSITNDTAFETVYRFNVGGDDLPPTDDSLFRPWLMDNGYLRGSPGYISDRLDIRSVNYTSETPPYTAPEAVYLTGRISDRNDSRNITWSFAVDPGFLYLLRLHFCEYFVDMNIVEVGDRVFTVFIDNRTEETDVDVIYFGGGHPLVAVKRDYLVSVPKADGLQDKTVLWLAMHPTASSRMNVTLLNGLEILKLSAPNRNLSGPNPPLSSDPESPIQPPPQGKKNKGASPALILGIAGGSLALLISLLGFLIFMRRRKRADGREKDTKALWAPLPDKSTSSTTQGGGSSGSSLPSDLCRHFSLEEIVSATGGFDDNFLIGVGGFGNVYKGLIDNGATEVAVKRLNTSSNQGAREFFTEIEMLSKLRHLHLVSLIGYCHDEGEMVLVYDYMSRGTLRDHLYKTQNPPLEWRRRLQICIGAAKGLHYLHTGAKQTIIHRDVKSTNILVDDKWVAKVSDFGLSKTGPSTEETHVSTAVKGSFGYVDPEYYKRQQLTDKSDVYSFGVVLLEVLCARPAMLQSVPKEQVNLAAWALLCHRRNTLHEILDPNLKGQIVTECLDKYVQIAFSCLKGAGAERPSMNDVVWGLEFALQLQDAAAEIKDSADNNKVVHGEAITTDDDDMFSRSGDVQSSASKSSDNFTFSTSGGFKSETVFSEIHNPSAR